MSLSSFISKNISLKDYNSWKVGGSADNLALPSNLQELKDAIEWSVSERLPVTVLGRGTNSLVSDKGIRGLVICLKQMRNISSCFEGSEFKAVCDAGVLKYQLMREFNKYKLSPALFLSGLPGDVAGGVYMNAGVREKREPREFCQIVDWIKVLDYSSGKIVEKKFNDSEIQWSYRKSIGWQPGVIFQVGLKWTGQPIENLPIEIKEANALRLSKQPLDMPSCGSVFKNPTGESAGALIESCGLKGKKIGGAEVSTKHANFIVNAGSATADDILNLMNFVKQTVLEKKGMQLKTEVLQLGDW